MFHQEKSPQKRREGLTGACGGCFGAFGEGGFDVVAVGEGDYFELDLFRAGGFAFADIGAVGETFGVHLLDHGEGTAIAFYLALRQVTEVRDFCAYEEGGSGVGASSYAGSATDTGRRIHGEISILLLDGNGVAIGGAAGRNGDKTTSGDDSIERAAVYGQVLYNGKCFSAPGFEINLVAVFEVAHVKLANGRSLEATMSFAVDHHAAHAANAFATIVIESDGIFALLDEGFVDDVEHFEERHVLADIGRVVADHAAFLLRVLLTPDVESEFHL